MDRTEHAVAIFAPLGPTYVRYASLLSFGQDPRWRRFLVSRLDTGPNDHVLDVATGTGAVAAEILRQRGSRVTGVDQSAAMLATARQHLPETVELREASAERLPFPDASFDALTFTYLLRYVDDPAATLGELARVVKPGGTIAGLEFGVPRGLWRLAWELWVRIGLPAAGFAIGGGWREVGTFLGPSITRHYREHPQPELLGMWRAAGIDHPRVRRLSLGGGVVTWGRKA